MIIFLTEAVINSDGLQTHLSKVLRLFDNLSNIKTSLTVLFLTPVFPSYPGNDYRPTPAKAPRVCMREEQLCDEYKRLHSQSTMETTTFIGTTHY